MTYEIKVQLLEIYNEQLRDLLDASRSGKRLDIRNTERSGVNVPEAIQVPQQCSCCACCTSMCEDVQCDATTVACFHDAMLSTCQRLAARPGKQIASVHELHVSKLLESPASCMLLSHPRCPQALHALQRLQSSQKLQGSDSSLPCLGGCRLM